MEPPGDSIWVNGYATQVLPLPDRGLDYGDGLFETLLLIEGQPLHLDLHLQRLLEGLGVLGFPDCLGEISNHIQRVLDSGEFPRETAMRVTVTRGSGPRGYLPPTPTHPRIVITTSERAGTAYTEMSLPAHLALAEIRWGCQPKLAGIKHLNRLEQVLAAIECEAAGADELVMLDQLDNVVSVSAGNIFLLKGGRLITPVLDNCGVRGTRRRLIIEQLAPALGLELREAEVSLAQMESAEEVFYCNALVGIRPVVSFAETTWDRHEVCAALHRLLCEACR